MPQPAAQTIRLHPADDVVIARVDILQGALLAEEGVRAASSIPAGHKIAVAAVDCGAPVGRYGEVIGFATAGIRPGDHVHVHNLAFGGFEHEHDFAAGARPVDYVQPAATFQGPRSRAGS